MNKHVVIAALIGAFVSPIAMTVAKYAIFAIGFSIVLIGAMWLYFFLTAPMEEKDK